MACMMKLGWRIRTERDSLWVKTLTTKYNHTQPPSRTGVSNAWQGIMHVRPHLDERLIRLVRNGRTTKFWMDRWITQSPLHAQMCRNVSLPELYSSVADYWREGIGWDWSRINELLPDAAKQKLASYLLMEEGNSPDEFGWGPNPNNQFSIKSAYEELTGAAQSVNATLWNRIWKIKVPLRQCVFLWLVNHGKVLTNVERFRRHLTSNACCVSCAGLLEDGNHLFRQCNEVKGIWRAALGRDVAANLDRLAWNDWLAVNIKGDSKAGLDKNGRPSSPFACGGFGDGGMR